MNKQPFYHVAYLDLTNFKINEEKIKKIVIEIPTVLKNTFEFYNDELLFTATSDVSNKTTNLLISAGFVFKHNVSAEPGDPADLM